MKNPLHVLASAVSMPVAFAVMVVVTATSLVVAAPPGSPFNMGETLDPACAPGDTNCSTVLPAASGTNTDITSLNLQSDSDADILQTTAGSNYSSLEFYRSEGPNAAPTIVSNDEELGEIEFFGYDGDEFVEAALIDVNVNGAPGNDDMPGRIDFYTTPDGSDSLVKRMTLDDDGELGIGTDLPSELLSLESDGVDADIQMRFYEGATSDNPTIFMDFAEGTAGAPTAVADGQTVAHFVGRVWDGNSFEEIATMQFLADDDAADGDAPGLIAFFTTPDGDTTPVQRMEIDSDGEVTLGSTTFGDEELAIGPSEGGSSSDTAISMENSTFVYEIHVEDSNEFVIYQNEDEDSGDSVLMYNGTTQHWGFGTDPDGDEISVDNGASLSAGGVWTDASSRALKKDIEAISLEDALRALNGLEPVSFEYLSEEDEQYLGFIAEDVPDLVAMNGREGLNAMDIVAVLTKVMQDQQRRLDQQEERIQRLEALLLDN